MVEQVPTCGNKAVNQDPQFFVSSCAIPEAVNSEKKDYAICNTCNENYMFNDSIRNCSINKCEKDVFVTIGEFYKCEICQTGFVLRTDFQSCLPRTGSLQNCELAIDAENCEICQDGFGHLLQNGKYTCAPKDTLVNCNVIQNSGNENDYLVCIECNNPSLNVFKHSEKKCVEFQCTGVTN